jgi:hypothetical protein
MQKEEKGGGNEAPKAPTGNASNPSPSEQGADTDNTNQLIDPKGEKYLREVASIEDLPDAEEDNEESKQ